MPLTQKSAILDQQELQMLLQASPSVKGTLFPIYSSVDITISQHIPCKYTADLEALILQLEASPLGSAVILHSDLEKLSIANLITALLKQRLDINVFWIGQLPSMEMDIPFFKHVADQNELICRIKDWQNANLLQFDSWQYNYRTAMITEQTTEFLPKHFQVHNNFELYNALQAMDSIDDLQLLIIDLKTPKLRLVEILKNLLIRGQTPFLLLFGDIPENLSHAIYTMISNLGFSIIACLTRSPTPNQYQSILFSIFSKIYLTHWINEEHNSDQAKTIIDITTKKIEAYSYPYGMSKKQIAEFSSLHNNNKLINLKSLQDWFPNALNREQAMHLVKELGCTNHNLGFWVDDPTLLQHTSPLFTFTTMARLNNLHIYWLVKQQVDFSVDMLMFLPISDVILSKSLSTQLLEHPSQRLLDFIDEAQQQQIRLGANLEYNVINAAALSMYGIEFLLSNQLP